jgi:hypothetical protein
LISRREAPLRVRRSHLQALATPLSQARHRQADWAISQKCTWTNRLKAVSKPTVDNLSPLNLDVFHKNTTDESVAAPFQKESIHATEFGGSGIRRCNEHGLCPRMQAENGQTGP